MKSEYDLVILGGGIAGYVAAIRAATNGLKVAVVEKEKLGGTCLHKGCIPTKALLKSADVLQTVKRARQFGIETADVTVRFKDVQKRKETIVARLYKGVQHLLQKHKIDVYKGIGRILGPSIFSPNAGTISVERADGKENTLLVPKHVIIATGSSPRLIPGLEVDGTYVLTSDEALSLDRLPNSIIIVGGGVIGIEWASLLNDFGVHVTVVEQGERILATEDEAVVNELKKQFAKRGISIIEKATLRPETVEKKAGMITVGLETDGETMKISAEKLLVSIGRTANIEGIGLENTNIEIKDGAIAVNRYYQTKEPHIYAIGDVIGGMQLAHVAAYEGMIAIDHLLGNDPELLERNRVPRCIYTKPEIASVGLSEEEAIRQGLSVKVRTFPFQANAKALIHGEEEGFIKWIVDQRNDDLIGIHIIGPHATELIAEAALAKLVDAANIEVAETIHPHPSLSEVFAEAAFAVAGKPIHI